MKERRTPQEKKLLSYARDGRNAVAEARGIAHRAISKRKAKANRAFRRAETLALDAAAGAGPGDEADVFVGRAGRRSWRKIPDAPLGEYVAARLEVREFIGMNAEPEPGELLAAGRKRARFRLFGMKGSLRTEHREP